MFKENKLNKYQRFIIAICSFLVSGMAFSDCSEFSCTDVYVDRLYPVSGAEVIYVDTSGNETSLNCTLASGVYTTINTMKNNSNNRGQTTVSMLALIMINDHGGSSYAKTATNHPSRSAAASDSTW